MNIATTIIVILGVELVAWGLSLVFREQFEAVFRGVRDVLERVGRSIWSPARKAAAERLLLRVLAAVHAPSRRGNGRHRALAA